MKQLCGAPLAQMKNYKCVITELTSQPAVVSKTGWSGSFGYEMFPRAMELWNVVLRAGEQDAPKVTGPIVHRPLKHGVTDTG